MPVPQTIKGKADSSTGALGCTSNRQYLMHKLVETIVIGQSCFQQSYKMYFLVLNYMHQVTLISTPQSLWSFLRYSCIRHLLIQYSVNSKGCASVTISCYSYCGQKWHRHDVHYTFLKYYFLELKHSQITLPHIIQLSELYMSTFIGCTKAFK